MGLIPEGRTSVTVQGREVPLMVRRSTKARRIRFRVVTDEIELVLPLRDRTRMHKILEFSEPWLARTWTTLEYRRLASAGSDTVLLRGERLKLEDLGVELEDYAKVLRAEAKRDLPRLVESVAERTGLCPTKVVVRDQSSRWGSCSRRGTVSLNWRLLMAPGWVAEYVIVHELCHLRHMDHSADFWRLVESHFPDMRAAKDWLKAHGHELMRLRVAKPSG